MDKVDSYLARLGELYGGIKRARGPFLYTQRGIRLTDLYQDDGRAILGWRAGSSLTVMKRLIERGAVGSYRTAEHHRLVRAVAALFADGIQSPAAQGMIRAAGTAAPLAHEDLSSSDAARGHHTDIEVLAFAHEGDCLFCASAIAAHAVRLWRPWCGAVTPHIQAGSHHSQHTLTAIADTTTGPSLAAGEDAPLREEAFPTGKGGSPSAAEVAAHSMREEAFPTGEGGASYSAAAVTHSSDVRLATTGDTTGSPDAAGGGAPMREAAFPTGEGGSSYSAAAVTHSSDVRPATTGDTTGSPDAAGEAAPLRESVFLAGNGGSPSAAEVAAHSMREEAFPTGEGGTSYSAAAHPTHGGGPSSLAHGAVTPHTQAGSHHSEHTLTAIADTTTGPSLAAGEDAPLREEAFPTGEGGSSYSAAAHPTHGGGPSSLAHGGGELADAQMWANPLQQHGCVAFCPPLPWGGGIYLVAARSDMVARCNDVQTLDRAIVLPPPVEAACARAVWDLIAALKTRCEQQWFLWDTYTMRYWWRQGPYLYPRVEEDEYSAFCEHCLKLGIVINPCYDGVSIVPYGARPGVLEVLRKNPFELHPFTPTL